MSRLRLSNGDDHPEAARKHLDDAAALNAGSRSDGAAYLAGYVVECSLKTVILVERGPPSPRSPMPWRRADGHNVRALAAEVSNAATLAGARTARYVKQAVSGLGSTAIAAWTPEMRYRAPSMALADTATWLKHAQEGIGKP